MMKTFVNVLLQGYNSIARLSQSPYQALPCNQSQRNIFIIFENVAKEKALCFL